MKQKSRYSTPVREGMARYDEHTADEIFQDLHGKEKETVYTMGHNVSLFRKQWISADTVCLNAVRSFVP
jgi:hypothetical protein